MTTRKTAFAGSWYPGTADSCRGEIEAFLKEGPEPESAQNSWLAGIVPHAGWFYSGQLACRVINWLKDEIPPDIVVIFGMHLHPGSSNYLMAHGAWQTPLGDLPVSQELAQHLMARYTFVEETPKRFTQDNTIELQLPFIKYLLNPATILAIGVPPKEESLRIGRSVVDWARQQDCRLKVIGSTDLTHYGGNYGFAPHGRGAEAVQWVQQTNDRMVIDAMLDLAPQRIIEQGLQNHNACCAGAAATAVAAAKHMGAQQARQVAYASSYDKSPGESFVGYVGVVFG